MLVYAPFDLQKNELRQPQIHNLASAPGAPVKGQLYFNSGDNTLYFYDGTVWVSTRGAGAPADATTSSKGVVQLAGDLAGTATSPQIAAGVIVDTDVAAANKDGATGVPSLRTLGVGAQQAFPGNGRLDQVAAPTASVGLNGQKILSLADPTTATDGANKQYVDGVAAGLTWKQPVRVVGTSSISAGGAPAGAQTIDGLVLANLDRALLVAQTSSQYNGLWQVNTSGSWGRVADADTSAELVNAAVFVTSGTANADTGWVCTTDAPITVNTTPLTWVQFSGAGSIVDGIGLLKTGNTLDVRLDNATVEAPADIVQVKDLGITAAKLANAAVDLGGAKITGTTAIANGGTAAVAAPAARTNLVAAGYYSSATHGAGTTITITAATHGLRATRGLIVQCRLEATGEEIVVDSSVAANGDVTVTFAVSQTANTIRVVVIG